MGEEAATLPGIRRVVGVSITRATLAVFVLLLALLVSTVYVAIFNSRPEENKANEMIFDVERSLKQAIGVTKSWPDHDHFDQYP